MTNSQQPEQNPLGAPAPPPAAYPAYQSPLGAEPFGASDPNDLSLPLYGATFAQAISRFFRKYATFSGRASRSEFWWVQLFLFLAALIPIVLVTIGGIIGAVWAAENPKIQYGIETAPGIVNAPGAGLLIVGGGALLFLFWLAVLVPNLAISWRRLHDANLPGPLWFLSFTYIGGIVVLVLTILPPKAEGQRFDAR